MKILIAEDHEAIRSGVIRVLLQWRGDVEYAEALNGRDAVDKAIVWKPDLVLLDVRLPVLSGFDAAREIKQHEAGIPILFFSIHDTSEILEEAKSLGNGFVLKDKVVQMLPKALDALLQGGSFYPPVERTEEEK